MSKRRFTSSKSTVQGQQTVAPNGDEIQRVVQKLPFVASIGTLSRKEVRKIVRTVIDAREKK
jgi:hypothetical protein